MEAISQVILPPLQKYKKLDSNFLRSRSSFVNNGKPGDLLPACGRLVAQEESPPDLVEVSVNKAWRTVPSSLTPLHRHRCI